MPAAVEETHQRFNFYFIEFFSDFYSLSKRRQVNPELITDLISRRTLHLGDGCGTSVDLSSQNLPSPIFQPHYSSLTALPP
jgi:hypothetical protein